MSTWIVILTVAVLTYGTRLAGFAIGGPAGSATRALPPAADRFLAAVPLAAFAALIVPGIAEGPGTLPARVLAAVACAALMTRVSQLWISLGVGMLVYWLLTWIV